VLDNFQVVQEDGNHFSIAIASHLLILIGMVIPQTVYSLCQLVNFSFGLILQFVNPGELTELGHSAAAVLTRTIPLIPQVALFRYPELLASTPPVMTLVLTFPNTRSTSSTPTT
jgi:hypothetical protein